jgi:hypothetical protein
VVDVVKPDVRLKNRRTPRRAARTAGRRQVILYGRSPLRPRARADSSPAVVRSEMRSRSNSASAAKIPKTSFPAGVVVSMAAPWPVRNFSPDAAGGQVVDGVDEVVQVAAERVELPDDERVAIPQRFRARGEPGAVIASSGGVVVVEVRGVDTGVEQRVVLLSISEGSCTNVGSRVHRVLRRGRHRDVTKPQSRAQADPAIPAIRAEQGCRHHARNTRRGSGAGLVSDPTEQGLCPVRPRLPTAASRAAGSTPIAVTPA